MGSLGVSVSDVEINSNLQFYDKMKSADIDKVLIRSAVDLMSIETPNYQYGAARLIAENLRKEVFGQFDPIPLKDHVKKVTKLGFYHKDILDNYTDEELDIIDLFIDHRRDFDFTYVGIEQCSSKYLIKNRITGKILETPQIAYALIAATAFINYPKNTRMKYVKEFYDAISLHYISLPTPIMAGLRSMVKQYSSCVLINMDDSLPSITESITSIIKYIAQKAGIGVNAGALRAEGSPIRGGDAYHTGVVPFYRLIQSAVKSCSQGGVRGGAATLHYPMWHLEYDDMIVLKNNKGTEFNRVRQLDYSVQINAFLLKRLVNNENITFFSPSDVPGLYDAFFRDQDEFARLYEKYERDSSIRKKSRPALEVFSELITERTETGRIYIMFVDNVNVHSFMNEKTHPIQMSNLCQEITLVNTPLRGLPTDEIALCTLSNVNLGKITDTSTPGLYKFMKKYCGLANRALDAILEYQDYPVYAAEYSNKKRRPLGIGVINYAYYLAKNGCKFSDGSGLELTDRTFEAFQYALIETSVELAREFGKCEFFEDTKYAQGILPIDRYKKTVDELVAPVQRLDWDKLRGDVITYGMRNSCLSAIPPAETSAQISNSTNGIEPVLELITIKESKDGLLKQIVPDINRLKNMYELRYDMHGCTGYLDAMAVIQKWIDQAISTNTHYNPTKFVDSTQHVMEEGAKVPMSVKIYDILRAHRYGVKTLYYDNTKDGMTDEQIVENKDNGCGDACVV